MIIYISLLSLKIAKIGNCHISYCIICGKHANRDLFYCEYNLCFVYLQFARCYCIWTTILKVQTVKISFLCPQLIN